MDKQQYDIGIVGWWYNLNYGGTLTYFALNNAIKDMGHSVLMIQRSCPPAYTPNNDTVPRRFADKHYNISKRYTFEEMAELNNICDTFVVGSDQLWNPNLIQYSGPEFFLSFADDNKKKIAYATSFGNVEKCDSAFINKFGSYLNDFDFISVREDYSVETFKKDFNIDVSQVCDPIFLCDKKHFDNIAAESSLATPSHYVVNYLLDPNTEKIKATRYIREKLGITDYFNFTDLQNVEERKKKFENEEVHINAEIEDLVKAYSKADFIVTDSFHGTCLAIIFNKPFISFANKERGEKRFFSLLESFHLTKYLIHDIKDVYTNDGLFTEINYSFVNELVKLQKERGLRWLQNALTAKKVKKTNESEKIKQSIERTLKDKRCSGCGVCANVCPHDAIAIERNSEGFINPVVNRNKCIGCEICVQKCPSLNPDYKNNTHPKTYAIIASDEIRKVSSSGGMFTVVADFVLEQGGYVVGAAYKEDFSVEHIIIDDIKDLPKLRGSKYIQSDLHTIYPKVKKLLDENNMVLFTGMPCQVAGLYSYLGKDYDGLFTIDLLCHGITSSKVFEKYHKDVLNGKKLSRLEFKEKEPWGWHAGVNAYFTDGTKYSEPLEIDPYFIAYLNSISKNTTCEVCVDNKLPRQGDLTIGDFWGINRTDSDMYDKKGTSVVLVNNDKGQDLFDTVAPFMKKYKEESLDAAITGNGCIRAPYRLNKNRGVFFEKFYELDFSSLAKGCSKNELCKGIRTTLEKNISFSEHNHYYLAKTAVENAHGRQIVTWIKSPKFEKILKEFFNKDVAFHISADPKKVDNINIYSASKLDGNRSKYYVVALDTPNPNEAYKTLDGFGFNEIEDFICRIPKPIVLENFDCSKHNYYDNYGNSIEGYRGVIGKVIFRGCNNHIIIKDKVIGMQNLHFDLSTNSFIEIGEGCHFNAINKFQIIGQHGSSEISIENNCRLTNALFRMYNSPYVSSIKVGEYCTFETNLELHANSGKKLVIGRDCMFSHDIDLWAGDGHSIFDVNTCENTNSMYELIPQHRNELLIGNHVWVSKGAFIMHGTSIGDGSIIGAKSVVKGKYPNNCVIAGNPATIVKKDVAWSRDVVTGDINRCGRSEYVKKTIVEEQKNTPINNKRKVLILGGTGRMSAHLTKKCLDSGDDVTISVRGKHKIPEAIDGKVKTLILDRADLDGVKRILKDRYYDVVFDCSGYAPQCVNSVLEVINTKRYIYISTFDTYTHYSPGLNKLEADLQIVGEPYEPFATMHLSGEEYSIAKYHAEKLIANKYSDLNYAIVRIPFVMSRHDDFQDAAASRIGKYVEAVLNEKPISNINLDYRFNFVESEDEAEFLFFLSNNDYKGVVNFASSGDTSMREVIQFVEKETGRKAILSEDATLYPFSSHAEITMNLDTCYSLGYQPMKLDDWLYDRNGKSGKIRKYISYYKNSLSDQ